MSDPQYDRAMMKLSTLMRVMWAASHSHCVISPFQQHGGMMLITPPGHLKTSIMNRIADTCITAMPLSDINSASLHQMRQDMINERLRTLFLLDMQKCYERASSTASNIEGTLRAMIEEGFGMPSWQARQGAVVSMARCMLIAGGTQEWYSTHLDNWRKTGFSRRLLWCHYYVTGQHAIQEAIFGDTPLVFDFQPVRIPFGLRIPMVVDRSLDEWFQHLMRHQEGSTGTPMILIRRIYTVLLWQESLTNTPEQARANVLSLLNNFALCLANTPAAVELDAIKASPGQQGIWDHVTRHPGAHGSKEQLLEEADKYRRKSTNETQTEQRDSRKRNAPTPAASPKGKRSPTRSATAVLRQRGEI